MDIGCYGVQVSRFLFGEEPASVMAQIERDPESRIDWLSSAILTFPSGHALFTCSTQLIPYQRVQILGTKGRIEIEIPFNAPPDRPARIFIDRGGGNVSVEELPICDQYTIQADLFSRATRGEGDVPTPLEDSLRNMTAIEAIFESARTGRVVPVGLSVHAG